MYERVEKSSDKAGLPPDALVYVSDKENPESCVRCLAIKTGGIEEFPLDDFQFFAENSEVNIIWLDIRGLNSPATGRVMDLFDLHVLTKEDILDTIARPKVTMEEGYVFILGKRFLRRPESKVEEEQVALVMKGKCVLTIQETLDDSFPTVLGRLHAIREKRRTTDYLFYVLLDTLVDSYYSFIESLGAEIEDLDELLVGTVDTDIFRRIRLLKNELLIFRRNLWAMREVLHKLLNNGDEHFNRKVLPYLRDVYDNILQMWETIDMYRDMASSAMEICLSSTSNKLNEVMKVLTIISTVFIPINFIAGLYGMNFAYMPELNWHYGYPAVLLVMFTCVLTMLCYFRRKKWL